MSHELYLAYVAACVVLAIVPGPIVTLVVANGLRYGTRAALINVAGAQLGSAIVISIVAIGLTSLMATMGVWFTWVRLAGAAYLVWLGIKLIRTPDLLEDTAAPPPPRGGFFLQGFLVLLSNPKVLVFFGAFIPQFIDLKQELLPQMVILGLTFMAVAALSDGAYALLAGSAKTFLSQQRAQLIARISGSFLIGGGVWLALLRTR
ncbi:MAG: LysE family translocator [Afipia sp.]|jgi:threonine/homoserine/homoserine lactone efflux protein|nr:LysE family translocator [Afipia sp.]